MEPSLKFKFQDQVKVLSGSFYEGQQGFIVSKIIEGETNSYKIKLNKVTKTGTNTLCYTNDTIGPIEEKYLEKINEENKTV